MLFFKPNTSFNNRQYKNRGLNSNRNRKTSRLYRLTGKHKKTYVHKAMSKSCGLSLQEKYPQSRDSCSINDQISLANLGMGTSSCSARRLLADRKTKKKKRIQNQTGNGVIFISF